LIHAGWKQPFNQQINSSYLFSENMASQFPMGPSSSDSINLSTIIDLSKVRRWCSHSLCDQGGRYFTASPHERFILF